LRRHRGIPFVFVLCAAAAVSGQQSVTPSPTPADPAVLTVRSGVDAVQIDVFVTDAEGMPVRGLTADDFQVLENGKPRPLAAFRAVEIPIERREELERPPLAEPDVLSNDGPEGRVYMFVLDEVGAITECQFCEANILRTRRFVRQFIEQHFGPHDVGAVALLGRGLSTDGQDFTSNRRLLLEAVDKFSGGFHQIFGGADGTGGGSSDGNGTPQRENDPRKENRCTNNGRQPFEMRTIGRSQQMSSLRDLAELTARLPGQHKAMLIFSECFDLDVGDMVDYNGGTWGVGGDDAHAAMAAATRSNLVIYPIDPTGLSVAPIPLDALMAFRSVANITGGFALINSNSFDQAFERIVRENSTYYMLGFDSAYEKTDGRYVRVQVTTKRPGLTVHSRDGYVAPTRKEKQQNAGKSDTAPKPVAAALASPLQTGGVTLHVSAVPARGRGHDANVTVVTEIDASSLGLVRSRDGVYSGAIDLRYIATDAKRRIFPEVRQPVTVRFDPRPGTQSSSLAGIRVRIGTTLELPPGRYQIRVAAGTALTAGNVVYDLKVPDYSEAPLDMGGVALVNLAESGVLTLKASGSSKTAKPTKCWSSNCAAPAPTVGVAVARTETVASATQAETLPTMTRVFAPTDEIRLDAEVYDNHRAKKGADPGIISLKAALRDASGGVMQLAAESRPSTAASGQPVVRFALPLPLKDVQPGAYALDVTAQSSDGEGKTVSRSLPIQIESPRR
jgi:VWFA-related protein